MPNPHHAVCWANGLDTTGDLQNGLFIRGRCSQNYEFKFGNLQNYVYTKGVRFYIDQSYLGIA